MMYVKRQLQEEKSSSGDDTTNEKQCYQLSIPIYGQICQISENRDLFGNLLYYLKSYFIYKVIGKVGNTDEEAFSIDAPRRSKDENPGHFA